MKPAHTTILFVLLNQIPFTALRLAIPLYALRLGASPATAGLAVALFSVLPMIGSVHLGRLIDRKGMRALLVIATAALLTSLLIIPVWPSVPALLIVAALSGGAYNAILVMGQQLVGRYSEADERVTAYAAMSTAFAVSLALVPMATGFLIDRIGFRLALLVTAVLPPVALILLLLRSLPNPGPSALPSEAPPVAKGEFSTLLRTPGLLALYAFGILFTASWDIFLFVTPIYGTQLQFSASQIGIIVGSFSVAMFLVRLFAKSISARFNARQLLFLCLLIVGTGSLGFGSAATVPLLIAFALLMGLGQGLANPTLNALLYEGAPPHRVAEAMGIRMSIGKACQVVLPLLAGAASSAFSAGAVFLALGAVQLGAAFKARRPSTDQRPGGD